MIWDFLTGSISPWVWVIVAVPLIVVAVLALKGDGWKWAAGIAVAAGALFLQSKATQRGRAIERIRQQDADQKAAQTIAVNRSTNAAKTDDELNRELDRWTKQ